MINKKNTYWLASYPKSGNTWFRLFLNQLLGPEQEININDLPIKNTIASERTGFDSALGINSSDLLPEEIDTLRPDADKILNEELNNVIFRKIHDAYLSPYTHKPIISTKISAGVIYIIRNPLDVLVSYHHHLNKSIDKTLIRLNGQDHNIDQLHNGIKLQFKQYMGGWSHHVLSWTQQTSLPVCVIRYEDLLTAPLVNFAKATRFAAIDTTEDSLIQAIENTRFDKLKQQELSSRFIETPHHNSHFFRKGIAGSWRECLTSTQVEEVISKHSSVMKSFGYIDEHNRPLF